MYQGYRQAFIYKLHQLPMCKQGSGLRRNSSYLIPPVFSFQLVSVTIIHRGMITTLSQGRHYWYSQYGHGRTTFPAEFKIFI